MKKQDQGARLEANRGQLPVTPEAWPRPSAVGAIDPGLEARIEDVLARLSLREKVGQVIQADISTITPEDLADWPVGSVLNGGNSAPGGDMRAPQAAWLALADAFWEAAMADGGPRIPLLWGTDAVHGHSNLAGATIFPHNINLGATRDLDLIERIGEATAAEIAAVGQDWTFSPTIAVACDIRWGRTYESYSEDPALVSACGAALIRGLQGRHGTEGFLAPGRVLATAKHFLGDGGTAEGRDQGDTDAGEATLRDVHAPPYLAVLEAGLHCVMASFSSWGGGKLHGRRDLLTDLLKDRWGFDGMVVGDWNGHGQLDGATTGNAPGAINAGLDMYMAPDSWKDLFRNLMDQVEAGIVATDRLDDAVRRVLRLKFRAGLFDRPRPSARLSQAGLDAFGSKKHARLAEEAVRKSAVLLKNNGRVLPLKPGARVLLTGPAAHDLGQQCGGWTLSWQGEGIERQDYPRGETLAEGIVRAVEASGGTVTYADRGVPEGAFDAAIHVFGEDPYAEFRGDLKTLDYRPGHTRDRDQLRALKEAGLPTIGIFLSGRPLWINPHLNAADAMVAAFLPGTHAGALGDLLLGHTADGMALDFTGRLGFSWPDRADSFGTPHRAGGSPPLFPFGYGLSFGGDQPVPRLHEEGVATEADASVVFADGAAAGEWSLRLRDEGGEADWVLGRLASPAGALSVMPQDHKRQEDAISLAWSGRAEAIFQRPAADLRREVNAEFALAVDLLVRKPPNGAVTLGLAGGEGRARFDISLALATVEGEIVSLAVPCKSFAKHGVHFRALTEVIIAAQEPTEIVVTRIAFVPGEAGALTEYASVD